MIRQHLIAVLVAINIVFYFLFLFFPLLSAGYVWDDFYLLKQLAAEQDLGVQPSMFVGTNFFRPIGYASFWLEGVFLGVNPTISHLINILLHSIVVLQIYGTCYLLLAGRCSFGFRLILAAAVSMSVGSLPLMAEPVAWVSARFEILCAIFLLFGFGAYVFVANKKIAIPAAAFCFLLALFSKEAALPFLLVLPVVLLIRHANDFAAPTKSFLRSAELWGVFGSMAVTVLVYILVRQLGFGQGVLSSNTLNDVSLGQHAVLISESLVHYARLIFLPWHDVQPFYAADLKNSFEVCHGVVLSLFLLVGIACLAGFFYFRWVGSLAVMVGFIMILPVINLVPIFPGLFSVTPRYLYLPVLVVVLVAMMILTDRAFSQTRAKLLVCALLLLCLGNFEATRSFISKYETNETFWDSIVQHGGVYHRLVALNQIAAKMAFGRFDDASRIIAEVREPLEFSEQGLERYEFPLAYYLGDVSAETLRRVDDSLGEILEGGALLGWRPEHDVGDVAWLLNMKALMLHHQCGDRQVIGELAWAALNISDNRLSALLVLAARLPESIAQWDGKSVERDLFAVEYHKFIMAFLQRDLIKCGISAHTSRFNKLDVSQRPPPIF